MVPLYRRLSAPMHKQKPNRIHTSPFEPERYMHVTTAHSPSRSASDLRGLRDGFCTGLALAKRDATPGELSYNRTLRRNFARLPKPRGSPVAWLAMRHRASRAA